MSVIEDAIPPAADDFTGIVDNTAPLESSQPYASHMRKKLAMGAKKMINAAMGRATTPFPRAPPTERARLRGE